ncbi:hypothetical protein BDV95DRAFT_610656 [Massariosphaeria phaeospora]|uniref:TPR-like protein n=1 Tax=Massariosphaeria phaeospora TaxID=100035 RepID=A0A7C8I468_9PLEO|nr:hypothetical protein BDV95DRAFT_610656 [Massariosphaeria phaeospora]
MAEAIALVGLIAAIPPLFKYGLATVHGASGISTSLRSTSDLLQEWNERLESYQHLIEQLEPHLGFSTVPARSILRCRQQVAVVEALVRSLDIRTGNGVPRFWNRVLVVRKKKKIVHDLSSIREQIDVLKTYPILHLLRIGVVRAPNLDLSPTSEFPELDPLMNRVVTDEIDLEQLSPQDLESALRRMDSELPANMDNMDSVHTVRSCTPCIISFIRTLTKSYSEKQISGRILGIVLSMTSRFTLFLAEIGAVCEAKEIAERILSWAVDMASSNLSLVSLLQGRLAIAERYAGDVQTAERLESEVLWARIGLHGESHIETIHSLNNSALALQASGRFDEALDSHRKALTVKEKLLGAYDLDTLLTVHNLGLCLQSLGQHDGAKSCFLRALIGRQCLLDPDHPAILRTMDCLAVSLYYQEQFDQAGLLQHYCVSRRSEILGKTHPDTLRSTENLALVLLYQHKPLESEAMLRKVASDFEDLLGPANPETLNALHNLARVLSEQFRYGEAEIIVRKCLRISESSHGESHPSTLDLLRGLAINLHCQEKYIDALYFAIRVRDAYTDHSRYTGSEKEACIRHVEQLREYLQRTN